MIYYQCKALIYDNELVSIVVLSEGNDQHLIETVRSIQAQTYKNWELMYVDDSQKDDQLKLMLDEMAKDKRIKISSFVFKNGPARARTSALKNAKGRWIAFIDAGDMWEPTKLEKQIAFMKEHDYAISYAKYKVIDQQGNDKGAVISGPEHIDRAMMMKCYWSLLLTVIYDNNKIGKLRIPNLVENNGYAILLLLSEKADCHLLDECLASQRTDRGLFNRVPSVKKFYWRYVAYRAVARRGRIVALARSFENMCFTLVKRLKYVEEVVR